eukprot:m.205474 g.205474  ORF g.205474 m.205474 type:complete len:96 (-) comp25326_c0_seq5:189-476(-)
MLTVLYASHPTVPPPRASVMGRGGGRGGGQVGRGNGARRDSNLSATVPPTETHTSKAGKPPKQSKNKKEAKGRRRSTETTPPMRGGAPKMGSQRP